MVTQQEIPAGVHEHSSEVSIHAWYIGADRELTYIVQWQVQEQTLENDDDPMEDEIEEQFKSLHKALARAQELLDPARPCALCDEEDPNG